MRVDAAEFVPLTGAPSADDSWTQGGPQPSWYDGIATSGLSADTPAFVPAQDLTSWQTLPTWEAWHADQDYGAAAASVEYGAAVPEPEAAPIVTYVDEETFLTPQLLDELPELTTHSANSVPLSPSGQEARNEVGAADIPEKELEVQEAFPQFELSGTTCATSSTCPSATTGSCAGVLSIHGRKLHWTLTGRDCQSCNDVYTLDEWPQGEGVESPRFAVAGVALRLVFFPTGAALTGDGDCAVGVLCEDKAKLKFELFLNDRRSGTKVMLGQKFSCDFRRADFSNEADTISVGLEVYSNLFYFGFS